VSDTVIEKIIRGVDESDLADVIIAKVDSGEVSKADLSRFLDERAQALRKDGETPEQAFSRAYTGLRARDRAGQVLLTKMLSMKGPDHRQQEAIRKYGG
jgi:hypothetical protein